MLQNILPFGPLLMFCAAILLGGFTNGLAGMAFAAVSGGILFAMLPAKVAVSVLAVCGLTLQVCNNAKMLKDGQINFKGVMYYIIPGIVGIPLGSELLHVLPKQVVALVFGLVLLVYVAFTFRKKPGVENNFGGRIGEMVTGFIGGLAAGMLALPGIPAVMWSSIRNYGKVSQRSLTVPFNFAMLLGSIAINGLKGSYGDPQTQAQLLVAIPVVLVGWYFGAKKFAVISEIGFRRFISVVMVVSGIVLVYPSLHATPKASGTATAAATKVVSAK